MRAWKNWRRSSVSKMPKQQQFVPVPYTGDGQPCPKTYAVARDVILVCQLPTGHPLSKRHQADVLIWSMSPGEKTPFTVYWKNVG